MKPSISSAYYSMLDAYEMVKANIETGFYQTEINEQHYLDFMYKTKDVKEFKRFIDDEGFSIPQGHLIAMSKGNITSRDNAYAISNLKRNIDVFCELGVKSAVLHYANYGTDWDPVEQWFDVRVDALNQLTDYIKGTDMSICIENQSRVSDFDAGHLRKMCKAVDNQKNIGICLDTGHLNISKFGNPYDFIMQAGDYLKAMHIHDNKGEHDGMIGIPCDSHMLPFDGGNVKWADVKRGVKELDYQYLFSFEVSRHNEPLEIKKIKAKYIMEIYKTYFEF